MMEIIQSIDIHILEFIQHILSNPIIDKCMVVITKMGDKGLIWIIIALALIINKKSRKVGILAIISLILATFLGEGLIKHLVQRQRPFVDYPLYKLIISTPSMYSFPSGHTASSFAVAGVLTRHYKKYRIIVWGLAFLIAFSRLYLFVHYPTDIIGGIILGLSCSFIVNKYVNIK